MSLVSVCVSISIELSYLKCKKKIIFDLLLSYKTTVNQSTNQQQQQHNPHRTRNPTPYKINRAEQKAACKDSATPTCKFQFPVPSHPFPPVAGTSSRSRSRSSSSPITSSHCSFSLTLLWTLVEIVCPSNKEQPANEARN